VHFTVINYNITKINPETYRGVLGTESCNSVQQLWEMRRLTMLLM